LKGESKRVPPLQGEDAGGDGFDREKRCDSIFRVPNARRSDVTRRKPRILIAKPGLDGHDRGARIVALALRDAGMEVIYSGLHQTPEMIANVALQENVDAIGLSILSGAHLTIFPKVQALLREKGLEDILLFGGGVIPPEDAQDLRAHGIGELFPPGSTIESVVDYLNKTLSIARR
jgi:methylmalonyl-CoA mutase, C-terminal domain